LSAFLVLKFGASTDDMCAGCGRQGHVAWLSGEVALSVRAGEAQPRVVAVGGGDRRGARTTTAFIDLYLCALCLSTAASLARGDAPLTQSLE
jgi:hypothetical protein